MRTRWIGVLAAMALVLVAACSSDGGGTKVADKPLTKKDLEKALITVDDFPDHDFTVAPPDDSSTDELFPDDECDDKLTAVKADLSAQADFVAPSGTTFVGHSVELYQGNKINELVDGFNTFLAECRLVRLPDGGQVTVGPLTLGALTADNVQTAQILFDQGGVLTEGDVVVLYKDNLVSTILLGGPRPTPRGVLDSIVRDALGKLGALAEGVV